MATFYGPRAPIGPNDGDKWINQTTGEERLWASGSWQVPAAMSVAALSASTLAVSGITTLSGQLRFSPDNSLDIGATGSFRPSTIFAGNEVWAAGKLKAHSGTGSPAAGGQFAVAFGSGTAGIYWGSGAPTVSAAKGSLYVRTDGSGTADRAYINTDGATTWTAITTAA
jgi:hypothetical protein